MAAIHVWPDPEPEEIAAILGAVSSYLADRSHEQSRTVESRWSRAGKLEAQGISVTRASIERGWRV